MKFCLTSVNGFHVDRRSCISERNFVERTRAGQLNSCSDNPYLAALSGTSFEIHFRRKQPSEGPDRLISKRHQGQGRRGRVEGVASFLVALRTTISFKVLIK